MCNMDALWSIRVSYVLWSWIDVKLSTDLMCNTYFLQSLYSLSSRLSDVFHCICIHCAHKRIACLIVGAMNGASKLSVMEFAFMDAYSTHARHVSIWVWICRQVLAPGAIYFVCTQIWLLSICIQARFSSHVPCSSRRCVFLQMLAQLSATIMY